MKLLVPCAFGVEASVKRELRRLGFGDCPAAEGRISLEGGWADVARLNVFLRAGERVLVELASFPAPDFDSLYEGVRAVAWEEFLTPAHRIRMDGKCVRSALMAVKAAGGVAKKAIAARLCAYYGVSSLSEDGARAIVGLSVRDDIAQITLDTSGEGLHKRGYRILSYDAPLRETTAAAMIDSSYFRTGKPFADLFCGSGTLPVEAALYALHIAPGAGREFDFSAWKGVPAGVLDDARREAADLRLYREIPPIFAADISPKAVSVAKYHAKRAGVERFIRFRCADMRDFASSERCGILMSNPPYGERLQKGEDLFPLYRDFSRVFHRLPDWSCYFLTAYPEAERAFGRSFRRRTLYNANLECRFYSYPGAKPGDCAEKR